VFTLAVLALVVVVAAAAAAAVVGTEEVLAHVQRLPHVPEEGTRNKHTVGDDFRIPVFDDVEAVAIRSDDEHHRYLVEVEVLDLPDDDAAAAGLMVVVVVEEVHHRRMEGCNEAFR